MQDMRLYILGENIYTFRAVFFHPIIYTNRKYLPKHLNHVNVIISEYHCVRLPLGLICTLLHICYFFSLTQYKISDQLWNFNIVISPVLKLSSQHQTPQLSKVDNTNKNYLENFGEYSLSTFAVKHNVFFNL